MENKISFKTRLKNDLRSSNWWYGALGGVVSTVVGIALTFGVNSFFSYRHEKKEAREMMFNVIKSALDGKEEVAYLDSIYQDEISAFQHLFDLYDQNAGALGNVPEDTLTQTFNRTIQSAYIVLTRPKTENYFYEAETMHQFGNPYVFTRFANYIEFDKGTFDEIATLRRQGILVHRDFKARQDCDHKSVAQVIKEMIEDHTLYNYMDALHVSGLGYYVQLYDRYYQELLTEMNASEEEFQAYVRDIESQHSDQDSEASK